jgi:hypothetical protein
MVWCPPHKSLADRINDANRELKLARRDGSADWIAKAMTTLDELLDRVPREGKRSH